MMRSSTAWPSNRSVTPGAPSQRKTRPSEGCRTSQSISSTRSPFIAADRASATEVVVLPSPGRAAVITTTRGGSDPSQSAARKVRMLSAKGLSGLRTT